MTSRHDAIAVLVERLTTTGLLELDRGPLKELKAKCKASEATVRRASELVLKQLAKEHAQIRFSSVQLIDELFQRSNVFRQAVTDDFAQFLHHAIGVQGHPLPPPDHAAEKLRELGLRCLRAWSTQFGVAYPQLAVAYEYVKSDTQLLASIASVQRREQEEARLKAEKQHIARELYFKTAAAIESAKPDILENLKEISSCLQLIVPDPKLSFLSPVSSSVVENATTSASASRSASDPVLLRDLGLGTQAYRLDVTVTMDDFCDLEDDDNHEVFDALRESYRLLEKRHIPLVKDWQGALAKAESEPPSSVEDLLKEMILLQQRLRAFRERASKLNLFRQAYYLAQRAHKEDDFDSETFETVPVPEDDINMDEPEADVPIPSKDKGKGRLIVEEDANPPEKKPSPPAAPKFVVTDSIDALKQHAPVVEYGQDLALWTADDRELTNVWRSLTGRNEVDHYWIPSNDDAVMPSDVLNELRKRPAPKSSSTLAEKREYPACRAPTPQGWLCRRRDMNVCPFHGKIIPRDDLGRPLNPADASSSAAAPSSSTTSSSSSTDGHLTWQSIVKEVNVASGYQTPKKRKEKPVSALEDVRPKKPKARDLKVLRLNRALDQADSRQLLLKTSNSL